MKTTSCLLLALLFSAITMAQNGINYKAVIKDASGNVIVNNTILIQFSIVEISASGTTVYQENHSPTTDSSGIIIVNIGEGTVISGAFSEIDWGSDAHFLNTQVDIGSGLVDLGTVEFSAVPYALNVTGLEALDEGNGIGWRLKGRDSAGYGILGNNAIDLSFSDINSSTYGASGELSTAMGYVTTASGNGSIALGEQSIASGTLSTAMGSQTIASGIISTALGLSTNASGNLSMALGSATTASGVVSVALGASTTASGGGSTAIGLSTEAIGAYSFVAGSYTMATENSSVAIGEYNEDTTDAVFMVGNGTAVNARKNALTISKSGKHTINSDTHGLVINQGDDNSNYGVFINSAGANGIFVDTPGDFGVFVESPAIDGVDVLDAGRYGGFFTGTSSGIHTKSSDDDNPDIILGGIDNSSTGDNGIIASDPQYTGSDIFLRSYDAVAIQLDYDNNETGEFEIKAGNGVEIFEITESGNATLAGTLTQNSDRRLKTDITKLSYGLNEIMQLQPKSYYWKDREEDKKSLGLIAQDVQPIISEIVNAQDDENKTLGISYTELIPILIKAMQEQQSMINKQADTILNLTQRVERLESGHN